MGKKLKNIHFATISMILHDDSKGGDYVSLSYGYDKKMSAKKRKRIPRFCFYIRSLIYSST
jgi:hypothetical protein